MNVAKIVDWLFATGAIRVSSPDKPFWYTSGLIGPYYVNTHFLIGSEAVANELLALMDATRHEPLPCTRQVRDFLRRQYMQNPIFEQVIDYLVQVVLTKYNIDEIDYVSGGERRDWFFSVLPAELLGKPHLTIFKDRHVTLIAGEDITTCSQLQGARVLHISDLVTEASSYFRAWIPALTQLGAVMQSTLTIVDRCQGGAAALKAAKVPFAALVRIDSELFSTAAAQGYLTPAQEESVASYLDDPYASMRQFLLDNPVFLKNALAGDKRAAERAQRLMHDDLYKLQG